MGTEAKDRMQQRRDRMRKNGYRQVLVWVPDGTQEEVRAFAEQLRKKAEKSQGQG